MATRKDKDKDSLMGRVGRGLIGAPPRGTRTLRLSEAGITEVQRVADRDGLTWSEAARRMLKFAAQKMPKGWH